MLRFSANLGFLWQELSLCEAIEAAADAGFDAVECHWPYDVAATDVQAVLMQRHIPMLGLNTRPGRKENGEFGITALPGREVEAREYIDEAVDYAAQISCRAVHVMAGVTDGSDKAEDVFRSNLKYASKQAVEHGITILVEPINHRDVPGYHLSKVEDAVQTIEAVAVPNLKLMFDCYHVQIMQGDLLARLQGSLSSLGHVQIAAVPDRGEPDNGDVDYPVLLRQLDDLGYQGYIGAEYRPRKSTSAGLGWMTAYRI